MATYSFLDTTASLTGPGGSFNLAGAGAANSEEGIDIERIVDKNIQVIGADGSVMNSLAASDAGKLRVRLLKTSPVNSQLSSLYNTQKVSSSVWGNNVVTVKNTTLGDSWTLTNVAFTRAPKVVYGREADKLEWEFDCIVAGMLLGGGGTVASAAALVQQAV